MCGEQIMEQTRVINIVGSPPRVRGTVVYLRIIAHLRRITPACAGNSASKGIPLLAMRITPACAGNSSN